MTYTFSDELIAHLAKAAQLAILTGTDIVDHFRMIQVEGTEDEKLNPSEAFSKNFEEGLVRLQAEIKTLGDDEAGPANAEQLSLDFSGA